MNISQTNIGYKEHPKTETLSDHENINQQPNLIFKNTKIMNFS